MRTSFLGISLDVLSMVEVREIAVRAVQTRKGILHCSLNALKVVEARRDPGIRRLLEGFDLITPDGMSVVWGMRLLRRERTEQVAGVDLMAHLLWEGATRNWRFFLLGTQPEVAAILPQRVEGEFQGVRVVGVQHGYFSAMEEPSVVSRIQESGADILFVGMPSPRKERFLLDNRERLGVPFAMGVGGGLDILAGRTRRAPVWMRRAGLEWSYRVIQEPRRLAARYLVTNVRFAGMLAGALLGGRGSRGAPTC
jgi:N-acetylglucosaminyldiphosphoundecaprenol N-acetyl-beta-D-mannosaminyltransferase